MSRCSEGQMPGSGETSPNPVFCAILTHPENTSAAAGAARTSKGQDRMARPGRAAARDRSCGGRSGSPRRDRTTQACTYGARDRAMVTAAMAVTTLGRGERVGLAGQRGQRGGDFGEAGADEVAVAPASLPPSVCPA